MKHPLLKSIAAGGLLLVLLAGGCDRDRSNPLDPQADVVEGRPATPLELAARGDVGVIRLTWQPVTDPDLAGYAVLRSTLSNGAYTFIAGEGDSTAGITTGKTTWIDTIRGDNRTFFYRVSAVDTTGLRSELSGFVGATSLADDRAPGAPSSVSAVALETAGEVVVRWSAPQTGRGGRASLRSFGVRGASLGGPGGRGAGGHAGGRRSGVPGHGSEEPDELFVQRAGLRWLGQRESGEPGGVGDVVGSFGAFGLAGGAGDRPDRAELGFGGRVVAGGLRRVSLVDVGRDV